MIVLGLTGSIGMGKSTTTAMFADLGAMVWNADDAVHRLYARGGAAVGPVGEAFPGVMVDGAVDRTRLAEALGRDEVAFRRLEAIVHPLAAQGRLSDLEAARAAGVKLAVLDIPLLFETGGDRAVDAVVVVTADPEVQAARVLARPGMTRERFDAILARQTPDAEKRARADFVIDSGRGLEAARADVRAIVETVLDPDWTSPRTAFPTRWRIASATPLATGIGGRVWRVRTADGGAAVIKQISGKAQADAAHALAFLAWRDGHGAIRLLDAIDDFQLLENAGDQTLTEVLDREGDAAATRIAATVLQDLGVAGAGRPALPSMRDRFAALTRLRPSEADALQVQAIRRLEALLASPVDARPLHGDIHHDNVLHGGRGWLAIDPHGVLGDPAYDAANMLYNPVERRDLRTSTERARAMAEILAPAVARPIEAVLAYGFCHACLSSAWHCEDGDETQAGASLDVARAILPLLEPLP